MSNDEILDTDKFGDLIMKLVLDLQEKIFFNYCSGLYYCLIFT